MSIQCSQIHETEAGFLFGDIHSIVTVGKTFYVVILLLMESVQLGAVAKTNRETPWDSFGIRLGASEDSHPHH